jgi:GNAT superfamily N-acetyltransferase
MGKSTDVRGERTRGATDRLAFRPLTPARWPDLEKLFGPRGACGGCWCMWWRLGGSEFTRHKGAGNKRSFKRIVDAGREPGILAYSRHEPIGWCALAPREDYSRLERSRPLARVDDQPVWSVTCLFVAKAYRRQGVSVALLRAAVARAAHRGARIVEGYPFELTRGPLPDPFVWTGLASAYRRAGFEEVARRSRTRPIMRCWIGLRCV